MTPVEVVAGYLAAGFAMQGFLALSGRHSWADEVFWWSLLWPLTLVLLCWGLAGRVLRWLGFRAQAGRPRPGLRWGADRVRLRDPQYPARVFGFWVACPLLVVSLWWVGRSVVARPWWHFWDPRSGLVGGLVAGLLLSAVMLWGFA